MSVLSDDGGDFSSAYAPPSPAAANQSFSSITSLDASITSSHANVSYASVTSEADMFIASPDTPGSIDSGVASPGGSDSFLQVASPGVVSIKQDLSEQDSPLPAPTAPDEKPSHSYIALISMAILTSSKKKLMLKDIYQYIMDNFPYYRIDQQAWKNSIRHNLSLNECFYKAGRVEKGKGNYWAIHPACVDDFAKGDYRRRHARRRARGKDPYNVSSLPISQRSHMGYVPMSAMPLVPTYHPLMTSQNQCAPTMQSRNSQYGAHSAAALGSFAPHHTMFPPSLATQTYQNRQQQQQHYSQYHPGHHASYATIHSIPQVKPPTHPPQTHGETPYAGSSEQQTPSHEHNSANTSQFLGHMSSANMDMSYPGLVYCDQSVDEAQPYW